MSANYRAELKNCVIRRDKRGYSYTEIAEYTGLTRGQVAGILYRERQRKLRQADRKMGLAA